MGRRDHQLSLGHVESLVEVMILIITTGNSTVRASGWGGGGVVFQVFAFTAPRCCVSAIERDIVPFSLMVVYLGVDYILLLHHTSPITVVGFPLLSETHDTLCCSAFPLKDGSFTAYTLRRSLFKRRPHSSKDTPPSQQYTHRTVRAEYPNGHLHILTPRIVLGKQTTTKAI